MPGKKYFSEEHKRNISEAKKGHKVSLETRKKISLANKGTHHSPRTEFKKGYKSRTGMKTSNETKLKLRLSHLGKKHSQEHKRKISEGNKGKVISQKTRQKISKALTGKKRPDISKIRKGMTFSKEHRKNISLANKGKQAGEKNPAWLGGKSFEPYGLAFNKNLKEFIRARDGYRCQECFKHETELFTKTGKQKKLSCHHIDYNKRNNLPSNLISLCPNCHTKTNFKRKDWTNYFQKRKGGI